MAFITFIAKKRTIASFSLSDQCVLGRSLDCDVFVPDMFVSRQHCRFERTDEGWRIVDLGSRNGFYCRGQRIGRRMLHNGDVIEIGTIAIRFNSDTLPPNLHTPAPFGEDFPLIELVDTVFAQKLHPSRFIKEKRRRPAWRRPTLLTVDDLEPMPLGAMKGDEPEEWTELDLEIQLAEGAEKMQPAFVLVSAEQLAALNASAVPTVAKSKAFKTKAPPHSREQTLHLSKTRLADRFTDRLNELREMGMHGIMQLASANKRKLVAVAASIAILWMSASWVTTRIELRRQRNIPLTINDRVAQGN